MISLYKWAKREKLAYSTATKLFEAGRIVGAVKHGRYTDVPKETKAPERETVRCAICGESYPQITGTHMKQHGTTIAEYKQRFPSASIVAMEVSQKISDKITGTVRTEENKLRISEGRTGIIPQNHPRFIKGLYTPSAATRQKMAVSHTGLKHTKETKAKIGDGNRGKKLSQTQVDGMSKRMYAFFESNPHPFQSKHHTEESRARMKIGARKREASYTLEQRAAINAAIGNSVRGIKRTPEQKERYRASRVKWMSENPTKVINTAGERTVAEWLDKHRIAYVRQFVIPGLHHPYDFFLPDHDTIIEFDGAHHWWRRWFAVLGKTAAERAEMLRDTMIKDALENMYAGLSGYRIIRIRGVADAGDSEEYGSLEDQLELQGFLMPS